jgi:CarD family transcriptional regulator
LFEVGSKVVYPMHGAGIIEEIEEKEILDEIKRYYILNLPLKEMKVMIPVDNTEELGIRPVVTKEELEDVFDVLKGDLSKMPKNWNRRFRKNTDKLKTGDILEVAEVVRNLMIMDMKKGLSTGERKMVNNSKKILLSEICLTLDIEMDEAEAMVNEMVTYEPEEDEDQK